MIKFFYFFYRIIINFFSNFILKIRIYYKYNIILNKNSVIKGLNNINIGKNFFMAPNCTILSEGNSDQKIIIRNNVALNYNVMINANEKGFIEINDNVMIGPNTVIRASNHNYSDLTKPIRHQAHSQGRIFIEEDVWIGANTTILANVKIGKGVVIGAGAVVTSDIPSYSVAVGVPAKVIKTRN